MQYLVKQINIMKFNLNNYVAIFFDFDGVIVDTEWVHFKTFNETLKPYKIKLTKTEYLQKYLAYDDKGCFRTVFWDKLGIDLSELQVQKLITKKNKLLMKQLKQKIKSYKDALEFINYTANNFPHISLCIVSGALRKEITYIAKKLKILDKFIIIVSAEDVKNGKPSPEPFLIAKKLLEEKLNKKIRNSKVLVIEDSLNGIIAAKKAKFKVVSVAHTYPLSELRKLKPDYAVKSLSELIYEN